jgi:hypothetical protein
MRRARCPKDQGEVELNMASMLDMAFQLLAFFILTFQPNTEGQIALHLRPPQGIAPSPTPPNPGLVPSDALPPGFKTLVISVVPNPSGDVAGFFIGENSLPGDLRLLDCELKRVFSDPANLFDQMILQVGQTQRYDGLMRVIGVCSRQTLSDGKRLSKLSFVEAPSGG